MISNLICIPTSKYKYENMNANQAAKLYLSSKECSNPNNNTTLSKDKNFQRLFSASIRKAEIAIKNNQTESSRNK